jgi:hypothetical protein
LFEPQKKERNERPQKERNAEDRTGRKKGSEVLGFTEGQRRASNQNKKENEEGHRSGLGFSLKATLSGVTSPLNGGFRGFF